MPRVVKFLMFAGAFLLLVFTAGPVAAQVSSGSISGRAVDPSGAAVPGAQVVTTNVATNDQSKTTTDSAGQFRVTLLPAGTYNVEISKAGFQKLVVSGVLVNVGSDHGLRSLTLQVGAVSTTVTVTGATPLMTTTQAQVSNIIPANLLANFPGIQENEGLDVIALSLPGVNNTRDANFSNTNGAGFSVNGLRGRTNDEQIDGQNNNDNSVGGPYLFLANPDFVQQYEIVTDNFGPEYGRNSGSVVNIVTKQGTNSWHGAINGTESNSVLDALSTDQKYWDKLTKVPRYNDEFTSATIGGPLWKNHVFIFGGFDNEIVSSKGVSSTGVLTPTPTGIAAMSGCYPGAASQNAIGVLQKWGPWGIGGGNPFTVGTPTIEYLTGGGGSFVPNAVDPAGDPACAVEMAGVGRTLANGLHEYDWVYRTDVVVSSKDRFYGRYLYNKATFFNTDAFGTAAAGYPANVPSLSQQIALSWTHTFTGRMVNEARFSYGRLNVEFGGNSIGNTIPNQQAIGTALANIHFLSSSLLGFGPATNAPQGRIVNTWQFQDNWSYFAGNHQFTAGVNFTRQRSPNVFLPTYNGRFTYANWSEYAQNVPDQINITEGNPTSPFKENDIFLYVGDNYQVTPNLTLNLGVTWSYYGQPINLYHQQDVARESNPATAFWDPSLPLSVRTFPSIPAPKNAVGPGVGFAYNPKWGGWLTGNGKTVIRGGYRLAYDRPYYNIYINVASYAPQVLQQTLSGLTAAGTPMPANPVGTTVRSYLAPYLVKGVSDPRSFNETTVSPNFGPDRVHEWSFGIQREFTRNAVFEARYVGNHGFDLFQTINANPFIYYLAQEFPNQVPSGVTPCVDPVVSTGFGRVNCNEGLVRMRTNTGYSDYNGLQLSFRSHNIFNQLTMRAGYTWSKTTDNVSEIFSTFGGGNTIMASQNPLNYTSMEHALSGLDIPNTFTIAVLEDLPMFRSQRGVIGHILGGWAVATSYILSSGQPYTPAQLFLGTFTGAVGGTDYQWNGSFIGTYDTLRPFLANTSAPASEVGIYAGDACNFFGAGCSVSADTLLSYNQLEANYVVTPVTKNQVHFIANGGEAQQIFGTPWGNAARNSLRDAKTNSANITLYKNFKFGEKATLQWHMTMFNAFNHPNFSSVDPFLEDAGDHGLYDGFAIPALTPSYGYGWSGGNRNIRFGIKILF